MIVGSCWYCVCVFLFFCVYCKMIHFLISLCVVSLLVLEFSIILHSSRLVERYCLSLVFFMEYIDISFYYYCFSGYSRLGCYLFSLRVSITSVHDLLAFRVSVEKSGVILLLYVMCPFYLTVFNILTLYCVSSVFIM